MIGVQLQSLEKLAMGRHVARGAQQACRVCQRHYTVNIKEDSKGLSLLWPMRHIRSHGDTLNISNIGVDIDGAFDGVTSVKVIHWSGALQLESAVELCPTSDERPPSDASVSRGEVRTTLKSGSLSATATAKEHSLL